jgi:hypothetical protein
VSTETARSGPSTAPTLSIARWTPKASPRRDGWLLSVISASRGAVRTPLPTRSMVRSAARGAQAEPTNSNPSLQNADSA